MFIVKTTGNFLGVEFEVYSGWRGKRMYDINNVKPWKQLSSAEKWIEKESNNIFGLNELCEKEYEIIELKG